MNTNDELKGFSGLLLKKAVSERMGQVETVGKQDLKEKVERAKAHLKELGYERDTGDLIENVDMEKARGDIAKIKEMVASLEAETSSFFEINDTSFRKLARIASGMIFSRITWEGGAGVVSARGVHENDEHINLFEKTSGIMRKHLLGNDILKEHEDKDVYSVGMKKVSKNLLKVKRKDSENLFNDHMSLLMREAMSAVHMLLINENSESKNAVAMGAKLLCDRIDKDLGGALKLLHMADNIIDDLINSALRGKWGGLFHGQRSLSNKNMALLMTAFGYEKDESLEGFKQYLRNQEDNLGLRDENARGYSGIQREALYILSSAGFKSSNKTKKEACLSIVELYQDLQSMGREKDQKPFIIDIMKHLLHTMVSSAELEEKTWLLSEGYSESEIEDLMMGKKTFLQVDLKNSNESTDNEIWENINRRAGRDMATYCAWIGISPPLLDTLKASEAGKALTSALKESLITQKSDLHNGRTFVNMCYATAAVLIKEIHNPGKIAQQAESKGWDAIVKELFSSREWLVATHDLSDLASDVFNTSKMSQSFSSNQETLDILHSKAEWLERNIPQICSQSAENILEHKNNKKNDSTIRTIAGKQIEKIRKTTEAISHNKMNMSSFAADLRSQGNVEEFRVQLACLAAKNGLKPNSLDTPSAWLALGFETAMEMTGLSKNALNAAMRDKALSSSMLEGLESAFELKSPETFEIKKKAKGLKEVKKLEERAERLKITSECISTCMRRGLDLRASAIVPEILRKNPQYANPMMTLDGQIIDSKMEAWVKEGGSATALLNNLVLDQREARRVANHWRDELVQWASEMLTEKKMSKANTLKELTEILSRIEDWKEDSFGTFVRDLPKNFTWRNLSNGERRWHDDAQLRELNDDSGKTWPVILGEVIGDDGWTANELFQESQLIREGKVMHHCVGGYAQHCLSGMRIFSLKQNGERKSTLSLSLTDGIYQIHQNKAKCNNEPVKEALLFGKEILRQAKEKYKVEKKQKCKVKIMKKADASDEDVIEVPQKEIKKKTPKLI